MVQKKCPIDPECNYWEHEDYDYGCKFVECCMETPLNAKKDQFKTEVKEPTSSVPSQ